MAMLGSSNGLFGQRPHGDDFYRAKEIGPLAEKMITPCKKKTISSYRQALSFMTREDVAKDL
jgi:ribosomal protein L17